MKYMLDTNICLYIIKKQPEKVLKKFKSFELGDVCISSITLAELMYSVEKSHQQQQNRAALEEFILPLEIIPFDDTAACHYGYIRAYLEKKAASVKSLDLMIAAHAQCLSAILVTNNKKVFSRIPKLKIENWVDT